MKMPNLSSLLNTFILLISSGFAVILSKKAISISLLTKETMNYLSGMKIKQFVKLDMKELFATTTSVNSELGVCSVCKEAVQGLIAAGAGGACGAACAATGCEPCVPYCASICGSCGSGRSASSCKKFPLS